MTTLVIAVTREHIRQLVESNKRHGDSTKKAVFNVLRYFGAMGIYPHDIKGILDTKARSEIRKEYENGNITLSPKDWKNNLKNKTISLRVVQRKLAQLVKEGSATNKHGLYSLTIDAKSDIRYFAAEFGNKALGTLMGTYFPTVNTVQRNLSRLAFIFGIFVLFCFIETSRPSKRINKGYPSTNSQKECLVSSCLQNMIPIKEMYEYFLTVAESQSSSSDNTAVSNKLVHPLHELIIERKQAIKNRNSGVDTPSALELKSERLSLQLKTLKKVGYGAYEKGKSWTELDEDKVTVLSEIFKKTFPTIQDDLVEIIHDFKNPKQIAISERECWPELF